jgi:hypothetical protein
MHQIVQQHQKVPLKKRPPLPKQVDAGNILDCYKLTLIDHSRILSANDNNSLRTILNRVSINLLKPSSIFVKKVGQPKNCSKSNTSIDSARCSLQRSKDDIVAIKSKFDKLRSSLDQKANTIDPV